MIRDHEYTAEKKLSNQNSPRSEGLLIYVFTIRSMTVLPSISTGSRPERDLLRQYLSPNFISILVKDSAEEIIIRLI